MTLAAFALVLLSATLDASWNLLAKKERISAPKIAGVALILGGTRAERPSVPDLSTFLNVANVHFAATENTKTL